VQDVVDIFLRPSLQVLAALRFLCVCCRQLRLAGRKSQVPELRSSAAKRALAGELRRLREHADISGDEAAGRLGWSPSKISRIETNRSGVKIPDLRKLLDLYRVSDERRLQLEALATEPEPRGWWNGYASYISPDYAAYISMEAHASQILCWSPSLIHGLLQTQEYARALMDVSSGADPSIPPVTLQQRIEVRLHRQKILTESPATRLAFVLDEATLLHRFGDSEVMRRQLLHLIDVAPLAGIDIRVLPFAGAHPVVLQGSFTLLRFPAVHGTEIDDVVYLETLTGSVLIEDPEETHQYSRAFEELREEALNEHATVDLIARTASETQP